MTINIKNTDDKCFYYAVAVGLLINKGVDIDAGEIVLQLCAEGLPIRLICASPYPGFENSWSIDWQRRYKTVMKEADLVRYICPRYYRGCFQIRNEWMVNHSARVQ